MLGVLSPLLASGATIAPRRQPTREANTEIFSTAGAAALGFLTVCVVAVFVACAAGRFSRDGGQSRPASGGPGGDEDDVAKAEDRDGTEYEDGSDD